MRILLDEKLNTDFFTDDNTEQFKLHFTEIHTQVTPCNIITLLWSGGSVYLKDPEIYADGSLASGRVTPAGQFRG